MIHSIAIPDALYEQLAEMAEQRGQSVSDLIEESLLHIAHSNSPVDTAPRLDWDTATAEESIADIRSRRTERDQPPAL